MKMLITLVTIVIFSCSMVHAEQRRVLTPSGHSTGYYVEDSSSSSIPRVSPGNTQLSNPKISTQSPTALQTQPIGSGQGITSFGNAITSTALSMQQSSGGSSSRYQPNRRVGGRTRHLFNITYYVSVDSINNSAQIDFAKKCIILPKIKDISEEDLQFKEYKRYVEKALIKKGFFVTDNPDEAAIVVFLNYDIYPEEDYYVRHIRLEADDFIIYRKSKKEKHLWRTDVISRGYDNDLRKAFPVLIHMAMPHIGEDTNGIKELKMTKSDKKISKTIAWLCDEIPAKP